MEKDGLCQDAVFLFPTQGKFLLLLLVALGS